MSAVSIFLLGTVALTNVALVGYLLADRNRMVKPPEENKPEKPSEVEVEQPPTETVSPTSRVGGSKFDVDEFMKKFEQLEQGVIRMNRTLDRIEGDVRFKDVEFTNDEDKPSDEEIAKDEAMSTDNSENYPQVAPENLDKVFEDARIEEFEGDTVSSPSATGFTTEEIEESVSIVNDPNSTSDAKAKAGRVLISMRDTNFSDAVLADEKIQNDLLECYRQSLRSDIEDKESLKQKPKNSTPLQSPAVESKAPSTDVPPPKKKGFHISKNFDDFNPEDLIRK